MTGQKTRKPKMYGFPTKAKTFTLTCLEFSKEKEEQYF